MGSGNESYRATGFAETLGFVVVMLLGIGLLIAVITQFPKDINGGVAVGVMSEILVGSISEASESIGLSPFFVGVIVVAIVGNAAEHWVAIYFASRDKMDLAVNIAIGSSAQIALFAAPVLVLLSLFVGDFPMALVFNGFELGAILLAILIASQVTADGESTWFEGVQLLAVYFVLGLAFYFA